MSIACEKCGADISWEGEYHPNCEKIVALKDALKEALYEWENWVKDQLEGPGGRWLGGGKENMDRIAELRKLHLDS